MTAGMPDWLEKEVERVRKEMRKRESEQLKKQPDWVEELKELGMEMKKQESAQKAAEESNFEDMFEALNHEEPFTVSQTHNLAQYLQQTLGTGRQIATQKQQFVQQPSPKPCKYPQIGNSNLMYLVRNGVGIRKMKIRYEDGHEDSRLCALKDKWAFVFKNALNNKYYLAENLTVGLPIDVNGIDVLFGKPGYVEGEYVVQTCISDGSGLDYNNFDKTMQIRLAVVSKDIRAGKIAKDIAAGVKIRYALNEALHAFSHAINSRGLGIKARLLVNGELANLLRNGYHVVNITSADHADLERRLGL